MRTILFIFLCLSSFPLFAKNGDKNDVGYQSKDTLILNDGNRFVIGGKLKLGYGTKSNKKFAFVYLSPSNWVSVMAGDTNTSNNELGSAWANGEMQIKDFKLVGRKKTGYKWIIVLGGGNIANYWCEIAEALETEEVITPLSKEKKHSEQAGAPQQPISKADELKN